MKKNVIVSLADSNYFPLLEELVDSIKKFKESENVVVTKGQQSQLSGIFIEKCSKKRAKLLINILNRSKEVFVKLESIQKVY